MTEVCKYLHGPSVLIKNDLFPLHQNNHNLRSCQLLEFPNPITVTYRLNTMTFRANQPWKKVPNDTTLPLWSKVIRLWNCNDSPCNICKLYISNLGYIN